MLAALPSSQRKTVTVHVAGKSPRGNRPKRLRRFHPTEL